MRLMSALASGHFAGAALGLLGAAYGTALGFGVFVVIVLTVVQLVFRVMRVTLGEWVGHAWVGDSGARELLELFFPEPGLE